MTTQTSTVLNAVRIQLAKNDTTVENLAILAETIDAFYPVYLKETNRTDGDFEVLNPLNNLGVNAAQWLTENEHLFDKDEHTAPAGLDDMWLEPELTIQPNGVYVYLPLFDHEDAPKARRELTHLLTVLFGRDLKTFVVSEYSERKLPRQTPLNTVA